MMTPDHPQWQEFTKRLEGPGGSNILNCRGGHDQTLSRAILEAMWFDEEFVAGSLQFFTDHGGHCDCEVLYNVEAACPRKREAD